MKSILNWSVICCLLLSLKGNAQSGDTLNYTIRMNLPLADLPFLSQAMKVNQGLDNFSMDQSLAVTHNIHRVNYYLNNRLWHKWVKPENRRKKIWNRVGANVTSGLIDYVFTYYGVVLSVQWLHEEYHRTGMTIRGISSYNETYNRFNGGFANGSVSEVKDEDLIRFKKEYPQEMVRSFSAGVESEFLLLRGLQRDNFFDKSRYPNIILNILLTKHAIDYVNQFRNSDYNASIDSMNTHSKNISDRDFVGWDFTPWVYDLHRPEEPYEARGIHPGGTGIDRAIKTTSLTEEEYAYLKKVGNLQYLNLLSPFMIGINRIKINHNTAFNFAIRHYLNSFGHDLNADLFLESGQKKYLLSIHGYRNKELFLPGIEAALPELKIKGSHRDKWSFHPVVMLWMQPENFYSKKGRPGGSLKLRSDYTLNNRWKIYGEIETKSKGWVAGNPYLKANTGLRTGISARFGKND